MYSTRRRLLIVLSVGIAVLLVGSGLYLTQVVDSHLTAQFDARLLETARGLASLTESEDGQIELDYVPEHHPEFERSSGPGYFQLWLDDGRRLYRSARLEADLPRDPAPVVAPVARDLVLPDGRAGRIVELSFVPRAAPGDDDLEDGEDIGALETRGLLIAVARERAALDGVIGRVRWTIVGVFSLAALLAVFFVSNALRRALAPIESLAGQVNALDADSLDARVELPETPEELEAVVTQLNALLERLDAAFARERRFTGNVAHELRTPIAELRSLALVGSRWPDDRAAVVGFFDDVKDIASRMDVVIGDLLLLARCDAGVEAIRLEPVPLAALCRRIVAGLEGRASIAGLTVDLAVAPELVVDCDARKLELILGNLLGNAVSYALPDTRIRCAAAGDGGRADLEISNAAEPISDSDLASLTEPFWRKDPARALPDHAGLGLSLVAALADLLGLDVEFDQSDGRTFRAVIRGLPVVPGRCEPTGATEAAPKQRSS